MSGDKEEGRNMVFDTKTQLANIAVVASETARITQALQGWPETRWQWPTYCPGWLAADAVAHLATGGDFYAQVIAAGRQGVPQLPWGASDAAEMRAARAEASKKLMDGGPPALMAGFQQGSAKLQVVFASLQAVDLAKVAWHPRGLIPIGSWVGMRLLELVIHDWDIRQPHEDPAHLAPTALPTMLTTLPEMHRQFLAQRLTEGLDGLHVLQAGGTVWAFRIQGKTVTSLPQAPTIYDTCLSADTETLILLSVGRADAAAKQRNGDLTVSGNSAKVQQLCATLFRTL
jgi:uncharacterized protein (TIGR03083 family)